MRSRQWRAGLFLCVFCALVLLAWFNLEYIRPPVLPDPPVYALSKITPYEEILVISERAVPGEIEMPPYDGGRYDYEYLRRYITQAAAKIYGVDPGIFDQPTLLSTSLLRDLVHKFNWKISPELNIRNLVEQGKTLYPLHEDVGEMWRYPSGGVCGHISFSLYSIYRSLGYAADKIDSVFGTVKNYSASHVTVQVYLADIRKFVVQDATFNYALRDAEGVFLSFYEARHKAVRGPEDIVLDAFRTAREAPEDLPLGRIIPEDEARIKQRYFGQVFSVSAVRNGKEISARLLSLRDSSGDSFFENRQEASAAVLKECRILPFWICAGVFSIQGKAPYIFKLQRKENKYMVLPTRGGPVAVDMENGKTYDGGIEEIFARALRGAVDVPEGMATEHAALFFLDNGWTPYFF